MRLAGIERSCKSASFPMHRGTHRGSEEPGYGAEIVPESLLA
jgi:hypothetical protein